MVLCVSPAVLCAQVKKAPPPEPSSSTAPSQAEDIAIGKLRGEDYNFEFQGKVKDGKMHFRLFMTQVGQAGGRQAGRWNSWRLVIPRGCYGKSSSWLCTQRLNSPYDSNSQLLAH